MAQRPSDHFEPSSNEPTDDARPLSRDGRRQVVIDVLATAVFDLLLKDHLHMRGDHEARNG
jgi:hypothetical protein